MLSRKGWLYLTLGTAVVLAVVSVADARGFRKYFRFRKEMGSLIERNQQLRAQNALILKEIESLRSDPTALEQAAREELGYIKPGEVVFNLE
jgi:cell division protein FtsB